MYVRHGEKGEIIPSGTVSMTEHADLMEFQKLRGMIEEKNVNVRVDMVDRLGVDHALVVWVTLTSEFYVPAVQYFAEEVAGYYNISALIFKIDDASHMVYIKTFDSFYHITDLPPKYWTQGQLNKYKIPKDKLVEAINKSISGGCATTRMLPKKRKTKRSKKG